MYDVLPMPEAIGTKKSGFLIAGSLVLLTAIFGFVAAFRGTNISSYSVSPASPTSRTSNLPSGPQTYEIVSADSPPTESGEGKYPKFVEATIDPLDVKPGDTQKMRVVVEDTREVISVTAEIETDNGTRKVELRRVSVSPVTEADHARQRYAVVDGKLHRAQNTDYKSQSTNHRARSAHFLSEEGMSGYPVRFSKDLHNVFGFLNLQSSIFDLLSANAASLRRFTYEGSWIVRDTHSRRYHTTFVAKSEPSAVEALAGKERREKRITLTWTDPCTPPLRGDWILDGNCNISSVGGLANGNLILSNPSYTLTLNATFVFYPGYHIALNAGQIAVGSGGALRQTNLWVLDADNDSYGTSRLAQDYSPGASYKNQGAITATQTETTMSAGAETSLSSGGTVAWSFGSGGCRICSSNNLYATADLNLTMSRYLQASNFGFSIPANSAIEGIKVEIERSKSQGTGAVRDSGNYGVRLVKGGTIQGAIRSEDDNWSASDSYEDYGGSSDLWGLSWTAADINASNFGVVLAAQHVSGAAATARVDHVRITVYYRPPAILGMDDCNDADNSRFQNLTGYTDADNDAYGNPATGQLVCSGASLPSPYVANNTDCADNDRFTNPGQTNYFTAPGGNGWDYNCNGTVEEEVPSTPIISCAQYSPPNCPPDGVLSFGCGNLYYYTFCYYEGGISCTGGHSPGAIQRCR